MKLTVIGGGPAGLRAAEVAALAGAEVTLFDAKASVGRKFLVAGRGGLNLTNDEPIEPFAARYRGPEQSQGIWQQLIREFDADDLRGWAASLGVETFTASTGRVYPREMKAAPLLRRWIQRLRSAGVEFVINHRWSDLHSGTPLGVEFRCVEEVRTHAADAVILALGGGSWPTTGSDGGWVPILERLGISVAALQPANCGWEVAWPAGVLAEAEGHPLKNIVVRAGNSEAAGELLITKYGLEGGAIYQLGPALREMAEPMLFIDLKPSSTAAQLLRKLGPTRTNVLAETRQRWRLSPAAQAVLSNAASVAGCTSPEAIISLAKACPIRLTGPRPLAEAISSAGGVRWSELDEHLMLRRVPGVFVAGEMIDWEAPTGGYLLHGCFATGSRAARGAVAWFGARHGAGIPV